jgi:Spy/CpxP family protein refolding chaperone
MKQMQWWSVMGLGAALVCAPLAFGADEKPADRAPRRAGPPAAGERGPGMGRGSEEWLKRLTEELKLTEAQKQKVEANQKAQMEKMAKLRQDTSLTQEARREKMRALREENDTKMKEILTTEQYEKWQKLRQERPGGPGRGAGERRGPGQGQGQGPGGGQPRGNAQ